MPKTIHLLSLSGDQPQWASFDGERIIAGEPSGPKDRGLVLALLPDDFFFYFHPKGIQTTSRHKALAAARLQMTHLFPAFDQDRKMGVLQPANKQTLGFLAKQELASFLERHQELLAQSNVISTPLTLCWFDAMERGLDAFVWRGEDNLKALFANDALDYFKAEEAELQSRMARQNISDLESLELEPALARLAARHKKLSALRIPVSLPMADQKSLKPYRKAMLIVLLVGLFFIAGQFLRIQQQSSKVSAWEDRTRQLYSTLLGPDPGPDPYGKLLFTLDQLQSGRAQGVDLLEVLSIISQEAPEDLFIENINLSSDSGSIMGRISTYDSLEKYLATLEDEPGYDFTLEQAANTDKGIQFHLRVALMQ